MGQNRSEEVEDRFTELEERPGFWRVVDRGQIRQTPEARTTWNDPQ